MRGAGIAIATMFAAIAGCGLATSGLMGAAESPSGNDASVSTLPVTGDAALPPGDDGPSPEGDDAGEDDATIPSGGNDSGAPPSPPDACSEGNDGGPIFTIAGWPAPKAPAIDGNLSEWPCTGWVGFSDANAAYVKDSAHPLAAQIQVRWDTMNIYVAARVTDAAITGDDKDDPAVNDSVEIYVSGDPTLDGDYDTNTHQYVTDWTGLIVDYGPEHSGLPADSVHAHFTAATQSTTGSWTFEASIAWQALYTGGSAKFASGNDLALDFEVNDGDGTEQIAALVVTMAPAATGACSCTQDNCCCGETPDVPSCDSQRITRVVLQ